LIGSHIGYMATSSMTYFTLISDGLVYAQGAARGGFFAQICDTCIGGTLHVTCVLEQCWSGYIL
ncbi:unnamed protein product, partial [Rotaria magnacalcarata]